MDQAAVAPRPVSARVVRLALRAFRYRTPIDPRIVTILDTLTNRERTVLTWVYGLDGTGTRHRASAARVLGLDVARLALIEKRALRKLGRPGRWADLRLALRA